MQISDVEQVETASDFIKGGLDWVLGDISSLKCGSDI